MLYWVRIQCSFFCHDSGKGAIVEVQFDKRNQLQKIEAYLVAGERLFAVFDLKGSGTGLVGVTDKRLIVFDKAFLRKKKAMVSVPYSHLTSIASEDSGGVVFKTSTLHVTTSASQTYALEFASTDKAHQAYRWITEQILQA